MSDNGDEATGGTPPGNGAVPRLTMGQRVLASLPNLQRQPAPPTVPKPAARRPPPSDSAATEASDGVVTPDEVLSPGTDQPRGRLRDSLMKPPPARPARGAPSGMNAQELNHIIKRLDDREQALAYFAVPLGVVVGVLLTVVTLHTNPAAPSKTHESASLIVFEGGARVVLSGVVALAAWKRRRSFVAFALLFLGTSMGFLFALPFWALGIWLIFRVLKWQKELAALTGSAARTRAAPAARGREAAEARSRARAERMSTRTAGGRRAKKQPEPAGPPKNKRYTPPKQERPRPPNPRPPG